MTSEKLFEKLISLINNSHKNETGGSGDVVTVRQAHGKLALHELKCEAIEIIFQHLLQNDFPSWFALYFSSKMLRDHLHEIITHVELPSADKLKIENQSAVDEQNVDLNTFAPNVVSRFHTICKNEYTTSSSIPEHPPCSLLYSTSVYAIKNTRRKMEDRHVVVPNLSLLYPSPDIKNSAFFAVFDGHGGQECSNYVAAHLLNLIVKQFTGTNPVDYVSAITTGFKHCETSLLRKCQRENLKSGTTAVVSLIIDKTLYIAWTGDSQAVLFDSSRSIAKQITPCHDTKNETDCAKIIGQGGLIMNVRGENRVNGVINVTRSLGDSYLKPPLLSDPEIITIQLTGNETCLMLGCDGLWEGISIIRCGELIRSFLKTNSTSQYCDLAKRLVNEAKSNDVSDNITALVVYLKSLEDLKQIYSND